MQNSAETDRDRISQLIHDGETLDDLQNGLVILQKNQGFRYGMDAVLLSGFARVRKGESVLDMGTGTGIIPMLLSVKTEASSITGLEIQDESADMALRSVRINRLEQKISIQQGDIKEAASVFGAASFDVITSNPPYMIGQHGLQNADQRVSIARHEVACTFDDLAREASKILRPKGRLFLIHRPFRLAELFATLMKYRLEPKRMRLVYPYVDREPNLVLIEALKDGKSRIEIEPPLIVYDKQGEYTDEVKKFYGDGR